MTEDVGWRMEDGGWWMVDGGGMRGFFPAEQHEQTCDVNESLWPHAELTGSTDSVQQSFYPNCPAHSCPVTFCCFAGTTSDQENTVC